MKLSVDNGDFGLLYDTDGIQIPAPIEADTETGEVLEFVKDSNDNFIYINNKTETKKIIKKYKPPLRFVRGI